MCTPLVEMKLDAVCALVKRLDIAPNRLDNIVRKFEQLNLGGLVLASCSLQDLKDALGVCSHSYKLKKGSNYHTLRYR